MYKVDVVLCGRLARLYNLRKTKKFRWLWMAKIYAWFNERSDGDSWTEVAISLDWKKLGFLWIDSQDIVNVYDEKLSIYPVGISGELYWNNEDKWNYRFYKFYETGENVTEFEVMRWMSGGVLHDWKRNLKFFQDQIGNVSMRYGDIINKMGRLGISSTTTELMVLRLIRDELVTYEGIGENAIFTLIK